MKLIKNYCIKITHILSKEKQMNVTMMKIRMIINIIHNVIFNEKNIIFVFFITFIHILIKLEALSYLLYT